VQFDKLSLVFLEGECFAIYTAVIAALPWWVGAELRLEELKMALPDIGTKGGSIVSRMGWGRLMRRLHRR
jgi:hypothetical protein